MKCMKSASLNVSLCHDFGDLGGFSVVVGGERQHVCLFIFTLCNEKDHSLSHTMSDHCL